MKKLFLGVILIFLSACSSDATLKVNNMWARQGKMDGNSAAYFTVTNNTKKEDKLISVESAVAEKCEMHKTEIDANNKMMMMPQEFIIIPVGSKVDFAPGGLHVMLLNLKKDLVPGEHFRLTLQFEKAGKIDFDFVVKE